MKVNNAATVADRIAHLSPCPEAYDWAKDQKSPAKAWRECERGDWMLWLLGKLAGNDPASSERRKLTLAACACARLSLKHVTKGEGRPLRAIETAEAWGRGDPGVTLGDVREARRAADAAAYAADAAAYAADAAAYAADAAAYAAAAAAAAAAARSKTLAKCADIVREFYPKAPKVES